MNNTEYLLSCDAIFKIMDGIKSNHIVERTFKNGHIELYNIIIDFWDNNIIPKNFLEKVYSYVNNEHPICERGNRKRFEYYNSGYKGCSQRCECVKLKYKRTMINKYGVDSPLKSQKIKGDMKKTLLKKYKVDKIHLVNVEQKRQTNMKRYGVEYPLQSTKIQNKTKQTNNLFYGKAKPFQLNEIQQQIKKENLKKFYHATINNNTCVIPSFDENNYYGISPKYVYDWKCNICLYTFKSHVMQNYHIPICKKCNPGSLPEIELNDFISSCGFETIINDRTIIKPKELDIVIPEKKIAIEYCGLYWHSIQNGKDKNYHKNKLEQANIRGYRLITIFEDEWINKRDIVEDKLKSILGTNDVTIDINQLIIKEIDNAKHKDFLNDHHIQSFIGASIKLGVYYNDELISVMTFNNIISSNKYELLRFATNVNDKDIANKLFKYFIKNYNPTEIITYCDLRWGTGELCKNLGFKLSHIMEPNCWYIDNRTISRTHEALGNDMHNRIWDCGSSKWILTV